MSDDDSEVRRNLAKSIAALLSPSDSPCVSYTFL